MKTVLFIPGYEENLTDWRDYPKLLDAIAKKGYEIEFVPITWENTLTEWVEEFNETYEKYDPNDVILAGFSCGAMIAMIESSRRPPLECWLFSLSPLFHEDFTRITDWDDFSEAQKSDFAKYDFDEISRKVSCSVKMFCGSKEIPQLNYRFNDAKRKLRNCDAVKISGPGHDVTDDRYIAAIEGKI